MSVASKCSTCFCVVMCLFLYVPFCHGALKLDISTLFTTFVRFHLYNKNMNWTVLRGVVFLSYEWFKLLKKYSECIIIACRCWLMFTKSTTARLNRSTIKEWLTTNIRSKANIHTNTWEMKDFDAIVKTSGFCVKVNMFTDTSWNMWFNFSNIKLGTKRSTIYMYNKCNW